MSTCISVNLQLLLPSLFIFGVFL